MLRANCSVIVRSSAPPASGSTAPVWPPLTTPELLGSAQIDVKISLKGRQPNKESATKPLCRYVSPATGPAYEKERHYVTHSVDEMVSI
jgi:hypothetical protein